jgi:hypothetical protein
MKNTCYGRTFASAAEVALFETALNAAQAAIAAGTMTRKDAAEVLEYAAGIAKIDADAILSTL